MTVEISRLDPTSAELREAGAQTQDAKASCRMLAIALVFEGCSRDAAAEPCAMASGRNRSTHLGESHHCSGAQWCELAHFVTPEAREQHRPAAGAEPCWKYLGISPRQLSTVCGTTTMYHPRCVPRRMEQLMLMPECIASVTQRAWAKPVTE